MWNVIKKDLLIIARDRAELLTLIFMPFILISILGFALGGLMGGNQSIPEIKVALVEEDQHDDGIASFQSNLQAMDLPEEAVAAMEASANAFNPAEMLTELLVAPEVAEVITTIEMDRSEAAEALEADEVAVVVTIPEGFTAAILEKNFLQTGTGSTIEVTVQEVGQIRAGVVENIIENFTATLNLETALSQVAGGEIAESDYDREALGGSENISRREPVTAFQYYTIGMAVMFGLYVAGVIASNALLEKQTHVFDRIMLTGQSVGSYLTGKIISTIAISYIQLALLFLLSSIIFQTFAGESFSFWLGIALISLMFSLAVGAISALLTAISLRFNSDSVAGIFSGGVVTMLAFVGGSFTPVGQISPFIQALGNWTPNGASMTAYIQLMQGVEWIKIAPIFIPMLGGSVVILGIAFMLFPTRRSA